MATYKKIFYSKKLNIYLFHFESESTFALYQLLGSSDLRPWSFKLLSYSPSTTGLALRFTLVCHNSDDLFNAFMVFDHSQDQVPSLVRHSMFLLHRLLRHTLRQINNELSHKILWEEFRIKTNHKVRPGIKGSV